MLFHSEQEHISNIKLFHGSSSGHLQQRTFAASPFSDPILVKLHSGMARHSEDPEMLWVMGPVLAVILIIVIVIAILLFKRLVWQITDDKTIKLTNYYI